MRIAYADPPYLGCCGLYDHHHPDGLCWDSPRTHSLLVDRLDDYDGWVLHASVPSLGELLPMLQGREGWRIMAWVKPFAAFKRNVSVAYAWEPVIVSPCRKPVVSGRVVMRDWTWTRTDQLSQRERDFIDEGITMQRGLTGAKPEAVCRWLFEMVGLERDDDIDDLFPGSGAVTRAWDAWRNDLTLASM